MSSTPVVTTLQTLKLLLPALIPSWRFFDIIAPSPRIEYTLLESTEAVPESWQEFRPRPAHVPVTTMLKRMLWNPRWNESLFLMSCAERLMSNPTDHSAQEIFTRIKSDLILASHDAAATPYLQFRLVFLYKHDGEVQKHVTFTSEIQRCDEDAAS